MMTPSFFCDGAHEIAVHNGVARVTFMRLDGAGKPVPTVEIAIPVSQLGAVMKAIAGVRQ